MWDDDNWHEKPKKFRSRDYNYTYGKYKISVRSTTGTKQFVFRKKAAMDNFIRKIVKARNFVRYTVW